jgi:radical SAM superfamily enzyme YgiQ (UPF0313 family)
MNVLLLNIPVADPTQPSLTIPTLASRLRQDGVTVTVWDLAIEAFHLLTSEAFLGRAVARIRRRTPRAPRKAEKFRTEASIALAVAPSTLRGLDGAKATLRDEEAFHDYAAYHRAMRTLAQAFEIVCLAYFPTRVGFHTYDPPGSRTAANILRHLGRRQENVFLEFFERTVVPRARQCRPDLIGLSITYASQFLPGLTLARLLRKGLPRTPILIGGAYLTAQADRIARAEFLWDFATGVVVYEGETALAKAADRVRRGRGLAGIPNLLLKGRRAPRPGEIHVEDVRALGTPDFSGIPLDQYLTPEPVLPIQASRGCYWNRCRFCSMSRATRAAFRVRPAESVVEDMVRLHGRHGARVFHVCDDSTPVPLMTGLAGRIRQRGLPYSWTTECRFEGALDARRCRHLAAGGCINLIFGLESGCQRVLDRMRKGTQLPRVRRILRACRRAGIAVDLQCFIGFPGESEAQARQTSQFLRRHRDLYTSVHLGQFKAVDACEVVRHPGRFHVTLTPPEEDTFVPLHEIETREGMSRPQADAVFRAVKASLRDDNLLGPGFLNGCSGAQGLLYVRARGRGRVDAMAGDVFAWSDERHDEPFAVAAAVSAARIQPGLWVLYERGGGHWLAVSRATRRAVQVLRHRPQPITSAAIAAVHSRTRNEADGFDAVIQAVWDLKTLAQMGMLVPAAAGRPDGRRPSPETPHSLT